jgi:hypothetical protein
MDLTVPAILKIDQIWTFCKALTIAQRTREL